MGVAWAPVLWSTSAAMAFMLGVVIMVLSFNMVISSPTYHSIHPSSPTFAVLQSQIVLGGLVTGVAFFGRCCFHSQRAPSLKIYMLVTAGLALLELGCGGFFLHQAVYPALDVCASLGRRNATSEACTALLGDDRYTTGYDMWQRVWHQATALDFSVAAGQLLQGIQNDGQCCGFSNQRSCALSLHPACAASGAFCSTSTSERVDADCAIAIDWDLPFGGEGQGSTGRCLEDNMTSGDGCYVTWLLYLQSQLQHLGTLWLVVASIHCLCVLATWYYIADSKQRYPTSGPQRAALLKAHSTVL
ncbi:hypothetical protein SPRG_20964 [Saprolegnia parasitica CBS 223.65]|uniref:Tetraspanin n=1 Tax=Saprolegnia parasitica (strain CBS 223.65) TaxID=695850 RepID=A0A067C347_SAPPC|nr:hypothetical protein SPRG_20964 [Saprolegnia parasitica CBS 223.65]KDO21192.1 hypothetical protein SPRG_20964 [Saprolegnia parasitica CBS 223.65]|eukprot:XP_012208113.1 hypothetical protein SPRG_20964 [Saprolegnia parasitica CBS 223.65]